MRISFALFSVLVSNVTGQLAMGYTDSDIQQLFETNTCERCDLSRAHLNNLDLKNANLKGADLSYADFSGSDLSGANLFGAYLYQATLVGVELKSANLSVAKLSGVNLTDANLEGAIISLGENQREKFVSGKPKIGIQAEGDYPEITSFDLSGNSKYMTSKSGKLYKSKKGELTEYGDYVRNYPDLVATYQSYKNSVRTKLLRILSKGLSIDEWGKRHWEEYGQKENRRLSNFPFPDFEVVLDLKEIPNFRSDQEVGLLSVATRDNLIYLSYTIQEGGDSRENVYLVVDEYSDTLEKIRTIIKVRTASFTHAAGTLAFDLSGNLYLSVGEGRISDYESQKLDSLLGKILRIDVSKVVPEPEVIAYGLRNPWKISIDFKERMFIGDCGEDDVESVYMLEDLNPKTPYNLGWPVFEGTKRRLDSSLGLSNTLAPIYEYIHHSGGRGCVIGGFFIEESNSYLFGDFLGRLRLLKEKNHQWQEIHFQKSPEVLSFGVDASSNSIYMSDWDKVYQLIIENEEINGYPWVIVCNTTMSDGTVNNSGC
jgi:hypothetical protein